jgi:hypothetical protein
VRAVAPSDDGDLVACLIAGGAEGGGDGGQSRLLITASVTGEAVAAVGLPVHDSGFVLANDDCSLILAGSSERLGDRRVVRAFVREDDELRPLWTEGTAPGAYGALALYGDWVFAATAEGIVGWRRDGERVSLPGSMRERMIFSRDGRHLLVSRVEEVIEVTSARTLFRLIDLSSLDEARRVSHVVKDRGGAQFALDTDLDLLEVRVTRGGELVVERIDWLD